MWMMPKKPPHLEISPPGESGRSWTGRGLCDGSSYWSGQLRFSHHNMYRFAYDRIRLFYTFINDRVWYWICICKERNTWLVGTAPDQQEKAVPFNGLVADDFRPPELYEEQDYLASRVDSWCLGWNTFYLLTCVTWQEDLPTHRGILPGVFCFLEVNFNILISHLRCPSSKVQLASQSMDPSLVNVRSETGFLGNWGPSNPGSGFFAASWQQQKPRKNPTSFGFGEMILVEIEIIFLHIDV